MKKDILIIFGKKIREERLKLKLSQEALAEKSGLHRTYIGMVERGEKNITLVNINNITRALNMKLEEIFKGIEYEKLAE